MSSLGPFIYKGVRVILQYVLRNSHALEAVPLLTMIHFFKNFVDNYQSTRVWEEVFKR